MIFSDPPKITQYSRSPSTRSLSVMQESPDSVHAVVDIAHAYIHQAVEQMRQSASHPHRSWTSRRTRRTRRQHMHTRALQPSLKVQCKEAEIEYQYDKDGRVTRYSSSEVEYEEHRAVSSEAPTRPKYEVPVSDSSKRPLLDDLLSTTR